MAAKVCEATVCIIVDADGDYAVGKDYEGAKDAYESDIRAVADCDEGFRVVWCTVKVPCPVAVTLTGEAPAEGAATLTVQ